jgi:hypothetical protein
LLLLRLRQVSPDTLQAILSRESPDACELAADCNGFLACREDRPYWWSVGTAPDIFERSAFSHSHNFDQRRRPETLRNPRLTASFKRDKARAERSAPLFFALCF